MNSNPIHRVKCEIFISRILEHDRENFFSLNNCVKPECKLGGLRTKRGNPPAKAWIAGIIPAIAKQIAGIHQQESSGGSHMWRPSQGRPIPYKTTQLQGLLMGNTEHILELCLPTRKGLCLWHLRHLWVNLSISHTHFKAYSLRINTFQTV